MFALPPQTTAAKSPGLSDPKDPKKKKKLIHSCRDIECYRHLIDIYRYHQIPSSGSTGHDWALGFSYSSSSSSDFPVTAMEMAETMEAAPFWAEKICLPRNPCKVLAVICVGVCTLQICQRISQAGRYTHVHTKYIQI